MLLGIVELCLAITCAAFCCKATCCLGVGFVDTTVIFDPKAMKNAALAEEADGTPKGLQKESESSEPVVPNQGYN